MNKHTVEYYSITEKEGNAHMYHARTELKNVMVGERRQSQKDIHFITTFV